MYRISRRLCTLNGGRSCRRQLSETRPLFTMVPKNNQCCSSWSNKHYYTPLRGVHTGQFVLEEVPFLLPDVGEGIQTVQIIEWLVKEGDTVTMGDDVCNVQSDKSAVTISVPYDGVVTKLMYEVDGTAIKDRPLMMIDVEGEEESSQSSTDPSPVEPPPSQDSTSLLTTPAVRKLAAEKSINLNQVSGSGKSGRILKEDILKYIEVGAGSGTSSQGGKILATPAVRSIAREEGVDLRLIQGTGEDGRVLKEDLMAYISSTSGTAVPSSRVVPVIAAPISVLADDVVVPVRGMQSVMVKTMTASGNIPQFGYSDEIDMGQLVRLRATLKDKLLDKGIKLSYMPVIVKALSLALLEYPMLNAHTDQQCTAVTYKANHNIGIAMDTPDGLIVPNVKQVQTMSVYEIAVELNRLQELGQQGKLPPADIVGGTFSLSNIGAVGGTYTKPMLLPPEVAIGAFGKVQVLPRFDESGAVTAAHVMQVSWSADHRVIDGATVARFSNLWKSLLENPASMIIDMK